MRAGKKAAKWSGIKLGIDLYTVYICVFLLILQTTVC